MNSLYSNGLQSTDLNPGAMHHGYAADKCSNCVMLSFQYGSKCLKDLVESMLQKTKAVLKVQYSTSWTFLPNKVLSGSIDIYKTSLNVKYCK